jgi:hypothetical protein
MFRNGPRIRSSWPLIVWTARLTLYKAWMTSAANIKGTLVGELEKSADGLVSVEWMGSGFLRLKRVITAHNGGVCITHAS